MICPKCQLTAEPMSIYSQEEDNEGDNLLYITWECSKCKGVVDTIYELISLVGPEIEEQK